LTRFRPNPIATKLDEIPWLSDAPADERELIDHHTTLAVVPATTMLCCQGEPGLEAFIILSGEATVVANGQTIGRIRDGDFCGEMALARHTVRSAHVVALTPMRLLAMSIPEFNILFRESPAINQRVTQTMDLRLEHGDE
jgi:CRP-like cAMP-binding protein